MNMAQSMANSIMSKTDKKGLKAGQDLYRKYFISISTWQKYKEDCDLILTTEGYEDVIVVM